MKITQRERIIDYMRKYGSITSYEACADIGVMQFGARIDDLMKEGYQFVTKTESKENRYGEPVTFKRYYLADMVSENMDHIPQLD